MYNILDAHTHIHNVQRLGIVFCCSRCRSRCYRFTYTKYIVCQNTCFILSILFLNQTKCNEVKRQKKSRYKICHSHATLRLQTKPMPIVQTINRGETISMGSKWRKEKIFSSPHKSYSKQTTDRKTFTFDSHSQDPMLKLWRESFNAHKQSIHAENRGRKMFRRDAICIVTEQRKALYQTGKCVAINWRLWMVDSHLCSHW